MKKVAVICKDWQDFVNYMEINHKITPIFTVVNLIYGRYTAAYSKKGLKSKTFKSVIYTDFASQNKDFVEIDKIAQSKIK